jgi:hypothetical protein
MVLRLKLVLTYKWNVERVMHLYYVDVLYVEQPCKVPKIRITVAFHWNMPFVMYPALYSCDWNVQSI